MIVCSESRELVLTAFMESRGIVLTAHMEWSDLVLTAHVKSRDLALKFIWSRETCVQPPYGLERTGLDHTAQNDLVLAIPLV